MPNLTFLAQFLTVREIKNCWLFSCTLCPTDILSNMETSMFHTNISRGAPCHHCKGLWFPFFVKKHDFHHLRNVFFMYWRLLFAFCFIPHKLMDQRSSVNVTSHRTGLHHYSVVKRGKARSFVLHRTCEKRLVRMFYLICLILLLNDSSITVMPCAVACWRIFVCFLWSL